MQWKILRTKIKSFEGKINAIFHNDRMQKRGFLLIDSIFKTGENYYF